MPRDSRSKVPALPLERVRWIVLALLLIVQAADRTNIVDLLGLLAVLLSAVAVVISVHRPVAALAATLLATLLNALAPDNALLAVLGLHLWMPFAVGFRLGWRAMAWTVLAQFASLLLLEFRTGLLASGNLMVRVFFELLLLAVPGLIGVMLRRYRGIARDVEAELRAESELFRRALSRELHDSAVHATTSMVMRANQALLRGGLDEQTRTDLRFIADTGRDATHTLRRTLASIRRAEALPTGPSADSAWFRARIAGEQARLEEAGFVVRATSEVALGGVPPQLLDALGRIATETVNNVLRHGPAGSEVTFMLENTGSALSLMCSNPCSEVERDDDPDRVRLGLLGMAELAEAQGGTASFRQMGGHWVAYATLPIPAGPDG
ncbi:MAG: histidine kinase [Pseudoclavibacter sp.]|nr:histidine kinase [Pseudoclavibacter sp.]